MSMSKVGLRTWIDIDKNALKINYKTFRALILKNCFLMSVVKSNAYGHGLIDYSKALDSFGADWFGVDSITEALALRRAGIKKPILVLGFTLPENFKKAAQKNISITISGFNNLDKLIKLQNKLKNLKIHLKIDTGMHRQGFQLHELEKLIGDLKKLKNVKIEGIYSHLASAKNPKLSKEALNQLEKFNKAVHIFEINGLSPMKHISASGGVFFYPQALLDLVRIGAAMYGLWPSEEIRENFKEALKLEPILSWKTIISEIKEVEKGEKIGYDFTETLKRKTIVGVCPVGYWHGIPRSMSSKGHVLVKGKRAKILGRVSMDIMTIDLTNIRKVKVGDVVTLIGKEGEEAVTADEIAKITGTINYEIVTRLNPLIKRFYL